MKYLSYRIRKNGFESQKKGKINYKSMKEQIEHDLRIEQMDKGYLKNPNHKNWSIWKKGLLTKDENNIEVNENYLIDQWEKVKEDYKTHSINNRNLDKRTRPFLTHVLSFSSGFMLDYEETKELGEVIQQFVNEEFGSFITITGHRDETSIHYHISTLNYDFRSHRTIGRNLDTSKLQNKIANHLKKHNVDYGHTRGVSKEITRTKHHENIESRKIELKKLDDEIQSKMELSEEIQNGIKDLKIEYNHLVSEYQKLSSILKSMIEEILSISQEKNTVKKLEKIENSIKDNLDNVTIEELTKLVNRMGRSIKTTERTSAAIIKKQNKMTLKLGDQ